MRGAGEGVGERPALAGGGDERMIDHRTGTRRQHALVELLQDGRARDGAAGRQCCRVHGQARDPVEVDGRGEIALRLHGVAGDREGHAVAGLQRRGRDVRRVGHEAQVHPGAADHGHAGFAGVDLATLPVAAEDAGAERGAGDVDEAERDRQPGAQPGARGRRRCQRMRLSACRRRSAAADARTARCRVPARLPAGTARVRKSPKVKQASHGEVARTPVSRRYR